MTEAVQMDGLVSFLRGLFRGAPEPPGIAAARGPAIDLEAQEAIPPRMIFWCQGVALFGPPRRLPELWLAATGPDGEWGDAYAALSEDDDDYEEHPLGRLTRATMGVLLDDLPAGPCEGPWFSPSQMVKLHDGGTIPAASMDAACRAQTALILGQGRDIEVVAYTQTRLLGKEDDAHIYRLEGALRRGIGTQIRAWPAGTPVLRLDSRVLRHPIEDRLLDWPLYVKLSSSNAFGENREDAALVEPLQVRVCR